MVERHDMYKADTHPCAHSFRKNLAKNRKHGEGSKLLFDGPKTLKEAIKNARAAEAEKGKKETCLGHVKSWTVQEVPSKRRAQPAFQGTPAKRRRMNLQTMEME